MYKNIKNNCFNNANNKGNKMDKYKNNCFLKTTITTTIIVNIIIIDNNNDNFKLKLFLKL